MLRHTPDGRAGGASRGPLEGIRVIDLSRVLGGPYCTMMLGDLGADVIKVEEPGRGDETRTWGPPFVGGESAYFLAVNRNKRGIALNLRDERARQLLLDLTGRADVLVENFKVGTLDRLGLGYGRLHELSPGLIYCSISGFGPDGPYAQRPGYDLIAEGMGGIMSVTGEPEGEPMKLGVAFADLTTGLFACSAILAALHERQRTGRGQHVNVSLFESVVALLANVGSSYLVSGEPPRRYGNAHPSIVPYQVFRAKDRYLSLAVGNDHQFAALCGVVGHPEWAEDPRFATNPDRVGHRPELVELLGRAFAERDAAEWVDLLLSAGVPSGPINTVAEVFADPQALHRGMLTQVDHPKAGKLMLAGVPFKLSETPTAMRLPPPLLGQHTEEVLRGLLGLTEAQLEQLRQRGAI